jgi:hypothetical protein
MPGDDATAAVEAAAAAAPPPPAPQAVVVHPYTVVNVKTHIPVTLEMKNPNFTKWASFFKDLCGKFNLRPHIDGPPPPAGDPSWDIAECTVRGWILNTVADSVLDLAITDENQSAHELWVAIEGLFRSNRAPRVVFLLEEFHSLKQGDLTIDEYCQRLKIKAAALRDVGETIEDARLVLSLLCGLNPCFSGTANDIANSAVLPSFSRAREMLSLKELRLANDEKVTAASAMVASSGSTCTSMGCRSSYDASTGAPPKGSGGGGNRKGKGSKKQGSWRGQGNANSGWQQGSNAQTGGNRPMGPWFCYNPWASQGGAPSSGGWQQGPKTGSWQQGGQGGRNQGLMGIRKKPEYVWKEYHENGIEKCSMAVYLGESQIHPNHPPFQVNFTRHRFPDTCQSVARKALKQLCQNYSREIFETPLRYFPPSNKNTPTWRKRLQALSGRDPTKDDPTIVYMVGYLHTLDNHYDDLSSHYTHLNSRVESLEQQVKELKQEKASLQECLDIAEGEEANTHEAY